jgi:AcrR family transcriptional regulator
MRPPVGIERTREFSLPVQPHERHDVDIVSVGTHQANAHPMAHPASVLSIAHGKRKHRDRIIAATIGLADKGHDPVQIRQVADLAGVSPSTVYRYFASKDDLLVAGLHHWLVEISFRCADLNEVVDPVHRVLRLVERLTKELYSRPMLAYAAARAYLYANTEAAENAELCRNLLSRMFVEALGSSGGAAKTDIGDLIADVWVTSIPAIVQQRDSETGLLDRLECALKTALL